MSAVQRRVPGELTCLRLCGLVGWLVGWSGAVGQGDTVGKIDDRRPKTPRPCYDYLISLPSATLKEMWTTAVQNQLKELIEFEVRYL